MRAVEVPFCFYPDPAGGTEVYVEALSENLREEGLDIVIAAPGKESRTYFHNKLKVKRFAVSDKLSLDQLYGGGDAAAERGFNRILEDERPDIVHFHAITPASSLQAVMAAKKKGAKVFFTYHTPTASCQRGTLIYMGNAVCDGKLDLHRCTKCTLQGLGLNRSIADPIGRLSPAIGRALGRLNLSGGLWTVLRMSELIDYRHNAFCGIISEVDHVVALCNWTRELLIRNSTPEEKITVIRQGLCHQGPGKIRQTEEKNTLLRLAYLGRLDPTKGVDTIIKALKEIPGLSIDLDIYGIVQGQDKYHKSLLKMADGDSRIKFKPPCPAEEIIETLQDYDLLLVPSRWLETGPMVILEAFAAGVAVIGSDLGGIAEVVTDGVDGMLVEAGSIKAWARAIEGCFNNRELPRSLRRGIRKPRAMDHVAREMKRLYESERV